MGLVSGLGVRALWRRWGGACLAFLALALSLTPPWARAEPAAAAPVVVVDERAAIALWPAVRVRVDHGGKLTAAQAAGQAQDFGLHTGTPANLGRLSAPAWLRLVVQVPGTQPVLRVLDLDYPPLNHAALFQVHQGQVQALARMGNALKLAERPMQARGHAVMLTLQPGTTELLLRVQSQSSVVLPLTLRTPENYSAHEAQTQLGLGIMVGLGLCMLIYSLVHWASLRDTVFLDYAVLLGGNILFTLAMFGLAGQHLWPDAPHWSMQAAPLAILAAAAAATRFMRATLRVREISRPVDVLLQAIGAAAVLSVVLGLPGWLSYATLQVLTIVLGLSVGLVVLPVAYVRARRGERVAAYILAGWAFYVCGAFTVAALLRGYVEPSVWTLYVYPASTMVEMAAWMAVLSLRVQTIHRAADRALVETETLRALAQTDALTGLPNRRGLQQRLQQALPQATPQQLLAVYLLDLDGFKPVNDRYGHDVGDTLLVAAGQRLQAQLRGSDVVARLGGDEFVVLAGGLVNEEAAAALGRKLVGAFDEPIDVAGQHCKVGLTAGYALAPLDGSSADELVKRADAAMYAGKQAGRHCVQRGGRSLATA